MTAQICGTRRLHHLDRLRWLAALVVVFHHFIVAFDFALYNGNSEDSPSAWDLWLASSPFDVALPGLLHRIGRRGLSSAFIEGAQCSLIPFLASMDGDMRHDETVLPRMLAALRDKDHDIAIGSPYVAGLPA